MWLYKVIDRYGNVTFFYKEEDLLESLDCTEKELKDYFKGKDNIISDLDLYIEKF